jgi:PKD domain
MTLVRRHATPLLLAALALLAGATAAEGRQAPAFIAPAPAGAADGQGVLQIASPAEIPSVSEEPSGDVVTQADYDYYTIESCRNEFSDRNEGLKYKNHFASCMVAWGRYAHVECGQSGCGITGVTGFRFTQIGFGSRTSQTMRFESALDEWHSTGFVDDSDTFTFRYTCIDFQDQDECLSTNPDPFTRTIGEWKSNGTLPSVELDTSGSVGGGDLVHRDADRVNYHQLKTFSWGEAPGIHELTVPFRCDAAPYLGSGGCIFHNVDAVHFVSIRPEDRVWEQALHILEAQTVPELTRPGILGKTIPGRHESGVPPLTRLYSGYDDNGQSAANNRTARATCVEHWGPHYARGPDGPRQCDEYPYASTFEGAYRSVLFPDMPYSYSAKPIDKDHNERAGRELGTYYQQDHILHGDTFYVTITGCDGCGGEPGPEPPPGNTPPTVDAGPDAGGPEGAAVALSGSVTDPDDAPSISWSYELGSDVDAGTTCRFGDPAAPATTITCTDDGTITVRLSADDGHGPPSPVSDSATVRISNVAPDLTLTGPQAWQLYRVGTRVDVASTFTDPGGNDTHTCTTDWDDGGAPTTTPATGRACDVSRTFDRAGMFTIRLTVADDDGGTDAAEVMVVVYDPRAGLVTSTGVINSPSGALTSNPGASGPATFLFAAKYLFQNSTEPTGAALEFLLPLRFAFTSTRLEWLVITPDGKVAIKGTGRVGGRSGYGFVAYAEARKLRLVVWPLSQGPTPTRQSLYDNRPAASYDVDLAQPQPITLGLTVIDTGWIPGLPPLG